MLGRLGTESRYHRFFSTNPASIEWELSYLGRLDPSVGTALVAEVAAEPDYRLVGLARYHCTERGHAEVALAVEDDCQHQGIGRSLLNELTREALRDGLSSLDLTFLAENHPVMSLVRRLVPSRARLHVDHGVFEASIQLTG